MSVAGEMCRLRDGNARAEVAGPPAIAVALALLGSPGISRTEAWAAAQV